MKAGLQLPAWAVGDSGFRDHPCWLPGAWGPLGCRVLLPGEDREGLPFSQELRTVATKAAFLPLVWLIGLSGRKGQVTAGEVPGGTAWSQHPARGVLQK